MERDCHLWVHIRGQNPQTGEDLDKEECTMVMQTTILLENARVIRGVSGAIESTRNEMVGIANERFKRENKKLEQDVIHELL